MKIFRRAAAATVLLTSIGLSVWAFSEAPQAVDPESLHPRSSALYVAWDGTEAHADAIEKTAQYKAIVDSGLMDYGMRLMTQSMMRLNEQMGAPGSSDELEQLLGGTSAFKHLYEQGVSLSVTAGDRGPNPLGTLVFHDAAKMSDQIPALLFAFDIRDEPQEKTINGRDVSFLMSPANPGLEIAWWKEGPHLVLGVGMTPAERIVALAEGDGRNVKSNKLWKRCRDRDDEAEVALVGWLDIGTVRDMFAPMPLPVPQPEQDAPVTVADVAVALGLDKLGAVGGSVGFDGEASVVHSFVDSPSPRAGLMKLADQPLISLKDLPPMPDNCHTFAAFSLDAQQAWTDSLQVVRSTLQFMPPEASEDMDQVLGMVNATLGMDVGDGLFKGVGNVYCIYQDSAAAPFGFGMSAAISVKDREAVLNAIAALEQQIPAIGAQADVPVPLTVQRTEYNGRLLLTLPAGVFAPTIGIGEDWISIGLYPQPVKAFFMRADGDLPSWKPSAQHKTALASLPKKFTSISVDDPREGLRVLYTFVPMMNSAIHTVAPSMGPDAVMAADLPPQELVIKPLFPNVGVSVPGPNGIQHYSRSSLPVAPVPSAEGGLAVPVLVALLLPAVQQAREAARRMESSNNMKMLGLSMHNYHDAYRHLPIGTVPNEKLKSPEDRLSFLYSILPFHEHNDIYDLMDREKGWTDEANREFAQMQIFSYSNPGYGSEGASTHYVGIAGVGKDAPKLPVNSPRAGMFGYDRKVRFTDVKDGLSNTAMMAETTDQDVPWAKGGATIRALTQEPYINGPDGIGGPFSGGCHILMGDGSVRFVSETGDPEVMKALSTIRGGERVPFEF